MLESPITLLRRLPATVRLLILGTFINKAGSFIVPFLTLVLRRQFQLSGETTGLLVAAYGVGSITSIVTGGALTDKLGRRTTLLVSLAGSGLLALAMGCSPGLRSFVPLLVLFGFLGDLYRPAASAIISDLLPSNERAVGYAALRLAVNLGFFFGMGLGGILADWNWRVLFAADGTTTLVYGAMVYLLIAETRPDLPPTPSGAGEAPSPLRDAVFMEMTVGSFLFCTLIFIDLTVLPLTITVTGGYPARVYGALVGANGLLIALFEVSLTDYLRRYRRLRVAALGAVLSAVGFGITGLVMHWAWWLLSIVLWTFGEILVVPQQSAFVADWSPPEARGRYLGFYGATWSLGFVIAPLVFLPLHGRMSEASFWLALTMLAIPMVAVLLHLDRIADRPERLRGAAVTADRDAAILPAIAAEAEG